MASLDLYQAWINLIETGEGMGAYSLDDHAREAEVTGEIHKYAGGRFRSVNEIGTAYTFDFTLTQLTLTQVTTLESWLGREVQVRTHNGQAFRGTFFELACAEYKNFTFAASMTLRTVSPTAGVVF